MYNNNSDFYEHSCCYPENWNYRNDYDEKYYREDNYSQWENLDYRKGINEKFDFCGRDYRCRCLNNRDNNSNHGFCCCKNFCRENIEQKEKPHYGKSSCGCCLCKIFRICR